MYTLTIALEDLLQKKATKFEVEVIGTSNYDYFNVGRGSLTVVIFIHLNLFSTPNVTTF